MRCATEPDWLLGQDASIDRHCMTDHEARGWAAKPYNSRGNLFGLTEAFDRLARQHGSHNFGILILRDFDGHRRVDYSRAYRVYANPQSGIIERGRAGQADHGMFARGIGTSSFRTDHSADR